MNKRSRLTISYSQGKPCIVNNQNKDQSSSLEDKIIVVGSQKKDRAIMRVLWGDLKNATPGYSIENLLREVDKYLKQDEENGRSELITNVAVGDISEDFLKRLGAKNIKRLGDKPFMEPKGYSRWYNKPWAIREILKEYNEVLFLDWDIGFWKNPDDQMWNILNAKESKLVNGSFQAPMVQYRRFYHDFGGIPCNHVLQASCMYFKGDEFVKQWLEDYNDARVRGKSEEISLVYSIMKRYGSLNDKDMVDNFEPDIIRVKRNIDYAKKTKKADCIYFQHK